MNTNLKHWKEAATLILAAGRRLAADTLPSRGPLTAASASPADSGRVPARMPLWSRFDYDVLMLKRSGKSGFMPNAYVFPGGLVDASDFSSEWLDVFKQFSDSPNFGLRSVKQQAETRPPMFATDRLKLGSPVPGDVAFRICALRETFEESGVLLVVPAGNALSEVTQVASCLSSNVNDLCSTELSRWRTLVNQDPCNFIRMCRELRVLPNIWALHEWSNWLTPVGRYGAKRFDTAFFICCLQEIPQALEDEKEIVQVQWSTPLEILHSYQAEELWIAPPQFYELSRFCRFPLLNDLHNFSVQRATEGCEQWLPIISKDEHSRPVSLLPGDKLYRLSSGVAEKNVNAQDHQQDPQDSGLHRIVILGSHAVQLQITVAPKYNHLLPVNRQALSNDLDGQL